VAIVKQNEDYPRYDTYERDLQFAISCCDRRDTEGR
jgi:hypothetical protein